MFGMTALPYASDTTKHANKRHAISINGSKKVVLSSAPEYADAPTWRIVRDNIGWTASGTLCGNKLGEVAKQIDKALPFSWFGDVSASLGI